MLSARLEDIESREVIILANLSLVVVLSGLVNALVVVKHLIANLLD